MLFNKNVINLHSSVIFSENNPIKRSQGIQFVFFSYDAL